MKYSMFIGRWQPWHEGHRWLINQRLILGKNVLICIRDVPTDNDNPYTAEEVQKIIEIQLAGLIQEGRVKVMIIPDIESVNYGRKVGYEIIEHLPPDEISQISATKIREETINKWKELGLLEGLDPMNQSSNITQLFESMPTQIIPDDTQIPSKGIKIVDRKPHKSVVKKYVCKDCGATLECTPNDITYKWYSDYGGGSDRYAEFNCPNCGKKQQYLA